MNLTELPYSLSFTKGTSAELLPSSFLPNMESKKSKNSLGFPLESAHPGFHGSGFLAAIHLTFIKNLTDETRLLLSFSVIIWFKEIKGLRKTKSRSWAKPRGGTPGGWV